MVRLEEKKTRIISLKKVAAEKVTSDKLQMLGGRVADRPIIFISGQSFAECY